MDAAAVEDREARLEAAVARRVLDHAVVPDERRSPAHLSQVGLSEIRGDHERPLREVLDRPQVGVGLAEVRERRQDREAEHGQRDHDADRRAEAERRGLEESRTRIGGERRRRCGGWSGFGGCLVGDCACLGLDGRHLVAHVARDLTRPEDSENDCDDDADRGDDPADDQPDEEARNPDREGDRPQARPRCVRGVVVRVAQLAPCAGFNLPTVPCVNDVPSVATRGFCTLRRMGVRTTRRSRTPPSDGSRARAPRGSSGSPRARAARPPREACGWRRYRACRRRTGVRERGRGGRAGPR